MIRAIAAIDDKRGIAKDGDIPWIIPEDTKYYRDKTMDSIIVMGSETYNGFEQPLPGRRNIVASRSLVSVRDGFELVSDIKTFLLEQSEDVWIIGGAGLYETTLEFCNELYLTHVTGDFNCDRFFPDYQGYALQERSEDKTQNGHQFYYAIHTKNR
jgi:dihydrofolate reductase